MFAFRLVSCGVGAADSAADSARHQAAAKKKLEESARKALLEDGAPFIVTGRVGGFDDADAAAAFATSAGAKRPLSGEPWKDEYTLALEVWLKSNDLCARVACTAV